jgi:hypothetical protein
MHISLWIFKHRTFCFNYLNNSLVFQHLFLVPREKDSNWIVICSVYAGLDVCSRVLSGWSMGLTLWTCIQFPQIGHILLTHYRVNGKAVYGSQSLESDELHKEDHLCSYQRVNHLLYLMCTMSIVCFMYPKYLSRLPFFMYNICFIHRIFHPRRACAARVTVLGP